MADKNWERRTLHSHGSHFRIDINNPTSTPGGEEVYTIYSVTDDEDKCAVGQDQAGKYKIHNDQAIEIVGGGTVTEKGIDVVIAGRSGDVIINADGAGNVKIRGTNVFIQADEDIDMQAGRNVSIAAGSGRVLIKGNTLEKSGLKGNLLEPDQNWAWRVFEGTGLPAYAFPQLISPFSGIADLAQSIAETPSAFGDLVGNSLTAAVSSATGGLVGGEVVSSIIGGNAAGGLESFARGAASQATGGLSDSLPF